MGIFFELAEWESENKSTWEMINLTLQEIRVERRELQYWDRSYVELYTILQFSIPDAVCLAVGCDPPFDPPPESTWIYLYNLDQAGRVWVGCYSSDIPSTASFIGEYCTSYYTTVYHITGILPYLSILI